ncbi:MAG: outer membrane beta-barrel protein [Deltaproteobacteria bacterium]|nr:outer membrane beta-barrel protein [Deltaproteobacteria bacterium]
MKALSLGVLATCAAGLFMVRPAQAAVFTLDPNYLDDYSTRLNMNAGAGVASFTGDLGDRTNTGPSWLARGTYDLTSSVGVEGTYLGAHNGIDDTRLPTAQGITTTSLQAALKLGAPLLVGSVFFKPYVSGGVGAAYYGVSGNSNNLYGSDSALEFPLAAGADAFVSHNVSLGARFDWMVNAANRVSAEGGGNQINISGMVGYHY